VDRPATLAAFRQIGTNAFPFLLDWMRYETRPLKQKCYTKLNTWVRSVRWKLFLSRGDTSFFQPDLFRDRLRLRAIASAETLTECGSEVAMVVPELTRQMNDSRKPEAARRALETLARLKTPEAFPPLLAALTNQGHPHRALAAWGMSLKGTNAAPAIPTLVQCLKDSDPGVRQAATNAVRHIAPKLLPPAPIPPSHVGPSAIRGPLDTSFPRLTNRPAR
jgi:hypothetical protein